MKYLVILDYANGVCIIEDYPDLEEFETIEDYISTKFDLSSNDFSFMTTNNISMELYK